MKKFRVTTLIVSIKEYEIVKETEKTVVYIASGREWRENKVSNYYSWYNTKEEAKEYLTSIEQKKIERFQKCIDNAKEAIEKIKTL